MKINKKPYMLFIHILIYSLYIPFIYIYIYIENNCKTATLLLVFVLLLFSYYKTVDPECH